MSCKLMPQSEAYSSRLQVHCRLQVYCKAAVRYSHGQKEEPE